jgi:O-antigen ligase
MGPAPRPRVDPHWKRKAGWQAGTPGPQTVPPARSSLILSLITWLLVVNYFGRPFEQVGVGLRIPAVICSAGILAILAAGYLRALRTRVGISLLLLVGWMLISTPFSAWRGGSTQFIQIYLQFWVALFLMVAGSSKSPRDLARVATVVAASCVFGILIGSSSTEGRLELKGTTYGNSDDVALLAGYSIPFVVLAAGRLRNPALKYSVMLAGVGYLLVTTGRTGTRAAIPAMLLMAVVYFVRGGGVSKALIVIFAVAAMVAIPFVLPVSTLVRLTSFRNAFGISDVEARGQSGEVLSEADASLLERKRLVKEAIKMATEHPIFGVGPGEFVDYRTRAMGATLDQTQRLPSHNTYLQVASELGFIGLFFYLAFLVSIYASIRRIRKLNEMRPHPDSATVLQIAVAMEAALAYFVVCAAFMTCDRHPHQFVVAGIVAALEGMMLTIPARVPEHKSSIPDGALRRKHDGLPRPGADLRWRPGFR